jgi:hypothetical protein
MTRIKTMLDTGLNRIIVCRVLPKRTRHNLLSRGDTLRFPSAECTGFLIWLSGVGGVTVAFPATPGLLAG